MVMQITVPVGRTRPVEDPGGERIIPAQAPSRGWTPISNEPATSSGGGGWEPVGESPITAKPEEGWTPVAQEPAPAPSRGGATETAGAVPSPSAAPAVPWFDKPARELPPVAQQGAVLTQGKTPFERVVGSIPNPRNIPQRVAEDFRAGVAKVTDPAASILERIMGGVGAGLSGVTGVSKALIRDPVLEATGDLGKANQAEMVGTAAIAPGGAIRSLPGIAGNYRAGAALRGAGGAPPVAGAARPSFEEALRASGRGEDYLHGGPERTVLAGLYERGMSIDDAERELQRRARATPYSQDSRTHDLLMPEDLDIPTASSAGYRGLPPPSGGQRPPAPPAAPPGGGAPPPPNVPALPGAAPPNGPMNPQMAQDMVLGRIGVQPKQGVSIRALSNKATTELLDALNPIKMVSNEAYELARLAKGSGGGAQTALRHGTYDFTTYRRNGEGLEQILRPLKGRYDELKAYLMARHADEMTVVGRATGINPQAASTVVANAPREIVDAAERLYKFQERELLFLVDAGLVSPQGAQAMRQQFHAYVPFYRVMDEAPKAGIGNNLRVRNPINAMEGSEREILDPLESIIKNTFTFHALAEKNRAVQQIVQDGMNANIIRPAATPAGPPTLGPNGLPILPQPSSTPLVQGVNPFTHRVDDTHFAVFENGQRKIYETIPEIARAINNMDAPTFNLATKMMAVPSRLVRAGVTLDPGYMARNLWRDQFQASIQSNDGYRWGLDWMKGLAKIISKDEDYLRWLRAGGAQSARIAMDRDYAGQEFLRMGLDRSDWWKKSKGVVTSPLELLRIMQEFGENATRVGSMSRSVANRGTSPGALRDAALESRNVTQDFERVGASMQALRQISEFTVAQMGGSYREYEAIKNNPMRTTGRLGLYVATPSVLLWAANRGDPRYEQLPWWEKDGAWIIPNPSDPNAPLKKIVKPFTAGVLAGGFPERVLTAYFDKHPEKFPEFLRNLTGNQEIDPRMLGRDPFKDYGKNLGKAVIPDAFTQPWYGATAVRPFAEAATGVRAFPEGAPVVPRTLERVYPAEQYTGATSEAAKRLGEAIAQATGPDAKASSPILIDLFLRGWTGTLGRYGMQATDPMLRRAEEGPKPEGQSSRTPVVGGFTTTYPRTDTQPVRDFYDEFQKLERARTTKRMLERKGLNQRAKLYENDAYARATSTQQKLSRLFRERREIEDQEDMAAPIKRRRLDELAREIMEAGKEGMASLNEAKKAARTRP